jgi:hypothetical protein
MAKEGEIMGLSFRKSIKIGKNTRINLSKNGGIGISTGVKGARISVNKQGVRTQVGKNGISYRKQVGWKKATSKSGSKKQQLTLEDIKADRDLLRKYNYKTARTAIKKGFKTCFILFCFLGFIDYISFKSALLLDSIAGIFIVIALGTIINICKKWIKANKMGLFITDDLDVVESVEVSNVAMDRKECLNEFTNILRNQIKVKK